VPKQEAYYAGKPVFIPWRSWRSQDHRKKLMSEVSHIAVAQYLQHF
jgi:hypothetical protein